MKVMTILGTRPEIIRLSLVMKKLDQLCEHVIVHTGQNYDESLSDIFLRDLGVRTPDVHLGIRSSSFGEQIGLMLSQIDAVLDEHQPDRVLILGDTNSALSAIVATRRGIPVYHMEAGNRCYDDRVPEEVNRRIVDHSSSVLLPYTQRSKENLLREGIENHRIYVTGNPINEIIAHYKPQIQASAIHKQLDVEKGDYFLVTMHRSENVDVESRLQGLATALDQVQVKYERPVICSLHPRTRQKMQQYGIGVGNTHVRFLDPLSFFDFISLEQDAFCVLSDSGTVQEECSLFRVPNVTIRDVTERPETLECGSNMLSGVEPDAILRCVKTVLAQPCAWRPPVEYLEPNVSSTVVKILLGYR